MITQWKLFNFKSVAVETELDFAPLTIFAGANSSGKSTFLQSILLVAQTLAHKISSRSVVLNGSLARLGQFDDLRTTDSEADQIVIGWTCRPVAEAQPPQSGLARHRRRPTYYSRTAEQIQEVTCEIAFDADPSSPERETLQIRPRLFSSQLTAVVRDPEGADNRYSIDLVPASSDASGTAPKAKWLNAADTDDLQIRDSLTYDVILDQKSIEEIHETYVSGEPVGCVLRHFLPEYLSIGFDATEEQARVVANALTGEGPRPGLRRTYGQRETLIPPSVLSLLSQYLGKGWEEVFPHETADSDSLEMILDQGVTLDEWFDRLRRLPRTKRLAIRGRLQENPDLKARIIEAFKSGQQKEASISLSRSPHAIFESATYLDRFFSNSVRYLGPLRDEPKPLYALVPHSDPKDVGLRGEMTAAVLDLNKNSRIQYIPSSTFMSGDVQAKPLTRTLEAAVDDWLKYLGVASNVTSVDRGKLGHEIKVAITAGGPTHDLMHVGVGVSQVLPIVVMCLLADPDTTLILEQPELHLHPKIQTRLADFFLSITLLNKQCIIETHSEYLISRLRFRAASEMNSDRVINSMRIYFVKNEHGQSSFVNVQVNEYGAILDWPEDFFDQSQREAEEILRAAALKRKSIRER